MQFDEHNPEYLTKALQYTIDHDISSQQQSVKNYCQQFDNIINAKKRDTLIQSLV